ncbi:MAG TPA: alkaline phosphatase family protein, partial [Polyangiaceae bacterium]
AGKTFYASDQTNSRLIELDAVAGKITRTIALDKNPSQIAFLDAKYLVVTESDHDALAIVDRVSGMVAAHVDVFESKAPHGFSPSALAYDAANKRLYATLASINAVEAYDVTMGSPPSITPAGRIPTAWWPTGVMVDTDGSLVVLNGKGHGTGTDNVQYTWGNGPITKLMRGSVQHVPSASLASLTPLSATVDQAFKLADVGGAAAITCPPGADDFPVPKDTSSGPSKQIKRVVLIIRENKTFDALFGDLPGVNGDPKLIMGTDAQIQAKVWQNARAIAQTFTNFDNFYTDAEQSIQGHVWTVYGRTTDYMERSWLSTWGRATRPVGMPTSFEATPEERGIFDWFDANGIDNDDMGEAVGSGLKSGIDGKYPGFLIAIDLPDVQKACYIAGRLRVRCDLKPFTYALFPNDHTNGGAAGAAAPEVMIAVNDEASGMLIDAFSRSPYWKDSLVIITEDDPQDGGDHVDVHRSILLMASPWVKRGYVSHGHYDMASVYKLVAHLYGIPYHNEMIREALLPVDAFTSTPDYTPFTYVPRTVTAPCNAKGTKHAKKAERWD